MIKPPNISVHKTTWTHNPKNLLKTPDNNTLAWLTKPYVLSHALRNSAPSLSLQLISQHVDVVFPDEASRLDLKVEKQNIVRKIFLHSVETTFVFARTIIPAQTYAALQTEIESVGDNFIGEYLIYNRDEIKRDKFEFAYLTPAMNMMQELHSIMPFDDTNKILWARRSCFWIKQCPLLITELFLEGLPIFASEKPCLTP